MTTLSAEPLNTEQKKLRRLYRLTAGGAIFVSAAFTAAAVASLISSPASNADLWFCLFMLSAMLATHQKAASKFRQSMKQ